MNSCKQVRKRSSYEESLYFQTNMRHTPPMFIRRSSRNKKAVYATLNQSLIGDPGISDYEAKHKRARSSDDDNVK